MLEQGEVYLGGATVEPQGGFVVGIEVNQAFEHLVVSAFSNVGRVQAFFGKAVEQADAVGDGMMAGGGAPLAVVEVGGDGMVSVVREASGGNGGFPEAAV